MYVYYSEDIILFILMFKWSSWLSWKIICIYIQVLRRVWRYQRGNQNPYIEEEQTTQWPKEKVQNDKQRSTKYTYKAKNRVIRTPLKAGGELRCSGRVSISCSTSVTLRVNLVTNSIINREWGKDREVFTTSVNGVYSQNKARDLKYA